MPTREGGLDSAFDTATAGPPKATILFYDLPRSILTCLGGVLLSVVVVVAFLRSPADAVVQRKGLPAHDPKGLGRSLWQ